MNTREKEFKRIIAIFIIFLITINCIIPSNVFGRGGKLGFKTALAHTEGSATTSSAITGNISSYKVGEQVEGEYMSGTYSGVTTGSSINLKSFFTGSEDISDKVKIEKFEIKIGDKVVCDDYENGISSEIEINSTDKFGFEFNWNALDMKGIELVGKTFAVQIGKFKGLTFNQLDLSRKDAKIGIETVGSYQLDYSNADSEGYRTLLYTINFTDKIALFDNVRGNYGGLSTFTSASYNEPIDVVFGISGEGTITIIEIWIYPTGNGWGPGAVPKYYNASVLEKSGKSSVNDHKLNWTVKFHDLIAKHQSAPNTSTHNKFDNIIIEDTLDRHQEFDDAYNGNLPFKFSIPAIYMYESGKTGISNELNLSDTDVTESLYEYTIFAGKDLSTAFTKITDKDIYSTINENVEKTSHSWAVVTEGAGSESYQKLIINLGPMGDSSNPFAVPYTKDEIVSKIQADIDNVKNSIDEVTTDSEPDKWKTSMASNLSSKWTSVYNLYNSRIADDLSNIDDKISAIEELISTLEAEMNLLPDGDSHKAKLQEKIDAQRENIDILEKVKLDETDADGIRFALSEFNNEVTSYIDESKDASALAEGISFYGENPAAEDILFPQVLVEYSDFVDSEAPIAFAQVYQDFKVSAKNYKSNFDKYASADGMLTFKGDREKLIAMYESAKVFFENEASNNADSSNNLYSYGFDMLYGTKLKAESVGKRDVKNNVIIKNKSYTVNSTLDVDNDYGGGIQGNNRLGDVALKKIDADTKTPIKDVEFEVFEVEAGGSAANNPLEFLAKGAYFEYDKSGINTISKIKTDSDGKIVLWGIPEKSVDSNGIITEYEYILRETTPKGYYEVSDVEFKPKYTQVTDIEIENYKRKAKLVKADNEDASKKLEGAEFKLYKDGDAAALNFKKEGNEYIAEAISNITETASSTLITDKNGEIIVSGLDAGTYYFEETKAPAGYYFTDTAADATDNKYTFTLDSSMPSGLTDNTVTVQSNGQNITNERIPGKISMIKKGEGETNPLENIPFKLYKKKADNSVYELISSFNAADPKYGYTVTDGTVNVDNSEILLTDSDGKLTIEGLPWGEYYLIEPWADYTGNDSSGIIEPEELKDYAYNATQYHFKIDAASVGCAPDGGKVTDSVTPKGDGLIKLKKGSSAGSAITDNIVINQKYKGSAELVKYDEHTYVNGSESEKKLSGAVFELHMGESSAHGSACTEIGTTYTTAASSGKITVPDLLPGDYHFVEIRTPQGYDIILDTGKTQKTIDFKVELKRGIDKNTAQIVKAGDVLNSRKPGEISIIKKGNDESGVFNLLAGAEFALYQKNNSTYEKVTAFNIDPNTIAESKNKKYTYTTGTNQLKDADTLVTDSNGEITVTGLPWGEYYLLETNAPDYFTEIKDAKYYFKIDALSFNPNTGANPGKSITKLYKNASYTDDFQLANNIVENIRNSATIQLIKYDANKPATLGKTAISNDTQYGQADKDEAMVYEKIQGASYKLYKQAGDTINTADTLIGSYLTGADGKITVNNLYAGKYYFVETSAPDGYKLDDTPIAFDTVEKDTDSGLISSNYFGFKFAPNEKTKYIVTLNKKDADDTSIKLENAEYELHLGDGSAHGGSCIAVSKDNINLPAGTNDGNVFKTDANGQIKIELSASDDTPIGKYHFAEKKAPDGYRLNGGTKDIVNFEITHDQASKNDIELSLNHTNNKIKYGVILTKYDSERTTGAKMANVEFKLYKNDGTPVANTAPNAAANIWKTDSNGKITISDLPIGDYYFEEVIPAGYRAPIAEEVYYLKTINAGDYATVFYGLSKKITFNITKREDSQTSDTALYYANIDIVNERKAGVAVLTKYGNDNILDEANSLKPLNKAVFKLYKQLGSAQNIDSDALISTKTTGEGDFDEGKIIFKGLNWGKYYVKETSAPNGYVLDETIYPTFTVNESSADMAIQISADKTAQNPDGKIVNKLYKANVKLIKRDANTDEPVSGATFKLYPKSGIAKAVYENKFTAQYMTDANGEINISNLPLGEYCFKEISPADGYYMTDDYKNGTAPELSFEVTASDNQKTIVLGDTDANKVTNSKYNIDVIKISSEKTELGAKLSGAKFWLYNSNKVRINSVDYITDTAGKTSLGNLLSGTYYLREVQAPDGYLLNDEYIEFSVPTAAAEDTYTVTVSNMRKPVDAMLKKVGRLHDGSLVPLSGAVFGLYKKTAGGEYIKQESYTSTTNSSGDITFKDLLWGDYYVVETSAPNDYILDSTTKYHFNINSDTTNSGSLTDVKINGEDSDGNINPIINEKYYGKVALIKKGKDGILLEGAKFELYRNDTLAGEYITDANGQINVINLELGKYYFKETYAADGYYINDEARHVEFDVTPANADVNKAIELIVKNSIYDVQIIKVDKNNKNLALPGAEFELYKKSSVQGENGEKVGGIYTTDSNGIASLGNLPAGEYYLKEIKAPNGYSKHNDNIEFKVSDNAQESLYTVTVENERVIIIDDDDDEPVPPTKPVTPEVPTEPEAPTETEAPTEPEVPTEPETPAEPETPINPEKPTEPEAPADTPAPEIPKGPSEITIVKKDENNNPVPDKEYILYDKDFKEIDRKVTDRYGRVTFTDLEEDIYYFEDEEVPGGPIAIDLKGKHVTVNVDGTVVKVNNLPYTSGNIIANALILIGAALILIGIAQTIIKRKKRA